MHRMDAQRHSGGSKGARGHSPPIIRDFFLKYAFNEFADIFGFDY